MGCVVGIPLRDFGELVRKELTPVSSDVFISIPSGVYNYIFVSFSHNQHIKL